ncbi:DUF6443 domain-containing protein [Chryseobacterium sp. JM1]|uniref:DUF6443 domain-containing protein n=1 Tax=Chryseobacterium sp. JM1 TaxID=1233950 RepID=UPI000690C856|nr:DUF6443 domain-containing protein [Chryseobacterium sp. JM1]
MKKTLIFKMLSVLFLLLVAGLEAQTSTENYVQSKTCFNGDCSSRAETVTYFDGLGRPKQIVGVKASPLGRDVVTHIEYDAFGRQIYDFLPVPQPGTQNGGIVPLSLANATQPDIYGQEKIFSEKVFENSPLDRILEQKHPGNAWSTKPVRFEYGVNIGNDVFQFITTTVPENNATKSSVSFSSTYAAGQLYRNAVTDEDGNKTYEYKNGKGQTILSRKMLSGAEYADTYYVYNEYNQLAFVIPPKAVNQAITETLLNELCYQYRYDGQGRLVEKKLPGKGWEYMLYDKQDRLVATQDAELRKKSQWLYTKYDKFGRVAITGLSKGGARSYEQALADLQNSNNVERIGTVFFNRQGMDVYYNNPEGTYPKSPAWVSLLSLNYYDTYPPDAPGVPLIVEGQYTLAQELSASDDASTKSLVTASYVKNIEDDK